MHFLRNLPIKRKLMVITMLVSGVASWVVSLSFITYEQVAARRQMVQDLSITAAMAGANSTAGLSFNEADSVEQALKSLHAQPGIVHACVYDRAGKPFARYQRAGVTGEFLPPPVQGDGHRFGPNRLDLFQRIDLAGETIGTIYLEMDLHEMTARIWRYALIMVLVLIAAGVLAFFLSVRLQKFISEPLSDLAKTVTVIAEKQDYSVRAVKSGEDELGRLIDGFNHMLIQIQERDSALQTARDGLEVRVQERTKELDTSLSLLNATLESTVDGILVIDRQGRVVSSNLRFVKMWGLPQENILPGQADDQVLLLALEMVKDSEKFLAKVRELYSRPQAESFDIIELKDGRIFERYSQPQRLGEDCVGRVWCFRDVTERKQAEAELAYERHLLRTLLENSTDHIYFKDAQSRFIKCSDAQAKQFGVASADQLVSKSDFDFFTEEHARPAFEDEQKIIRTGQPIIGIIERESWKDGRGESWVLTTKMPLRDKAGEIIGTFGISKDITPMKEAEARLEAVHRELVDASRRAGMAEVATSVLHNVGNVLNSVNVSTILILETLRKSKLHNLGRLAAMIREHRDNLAAFLTTDPKGILLPDYFTRLAEHLTSEQAELLKEVELTRQHVEHIKDIVTMQQSYAKVSGVVEKTWVVDLIEDALRLNGGALARHGVQVIRDFPPQAIEINVDRQKVLQVLVNLIRNAKYACDESGRQDKQLTMQVRNGDARVQIAVIDNGVGVPSENMTRIFNHGFTTREQGHGFGLHSGALAAKELGGTLSVHSDGPGEGAKFILELPLQPPSNL